MRIALVSGEASGDLLGAGLIKAIAGQIPQATFEGVAGPAMREAGCTVLAPSDSLAVMGLVEPLKELPHLWRLRRSLIKRWQFAPPDVFVGIDAPEFNLGLEIALRESGIRTVHYVSPTIWAWRSGRVRKVERAVDKVLCLFPFEKKLYDEHDVSADFVGHPLADRTPVDLDMAKERKNLGLSAGTVVAVLPGSREAEVNRLGPVFAEACKLLNDQHDDIEFVSPAVNDNNRELFQKHLEVAGVSGSVLQLDGQSQAAIISADIVLLACGTATLQTALLTKPMVSAYRVSAATFAIANWFKLINVSYYSLPNLLTDTPMVPEFMQNDATPEALANCVSELLADAPRRAAIGREFANLRGQLAQGADERAAAGVLSLLGK